MEPLRLVCRSWNDIILLWQGIGIHVGPQRRYHSLSGTITRSEQLLSHLERAGGASELEISLTLTPQQGLPTFPAGMLLAIQQAFVQARSISIYARHLDLDVIANLFFTHLHGNHVPLEYLHILSRPVATANLANAALAALPYYNRLDTIRLPALLPSIIHSDSVTALDLYRPSDNDIAGLPPRFPNLTALYITGLSLLLVYGNHVVNLFLRDNAHVRIIAY